MNPAERKEFEEHSARITRAVDRLRQCFADVGTTAQFRRLVSELLLEAEGRGFQLGSENEARCQRKQYAPLSERDLDNRAAALWNSLQTLGYPTAHTMLVGALEQAEERGVLAERKRERAIAQAEPEPQLVRDFRQLGSVAKAIAAELVGRLRAGAINGDFAESRDMRVDAKEEALDAAVYLMRDVLMVREKFKGKLTVPDGVASRASNQELTAALLQFEPRFDHRPAQRYTMHPEVPELDKPIPYDLQESKCTLCKGQGVRTVNVNTVTVCRGCLGTGLAEPDPT